MKHFLSFMKMGKNERPVPNLIEKKRRGNLRGNPKGYFYSVVKCNNCQIERHETNKVISPMTQTTQCGSGMVLVPKQTGKNKT